MRPLVCILLGLFAVSVLTGCVRRRMTVRSNPPGATVYLDGKEIGRTPFSSNFQHYGKREFKVVKQGYETQTKILPVRTPWYEWLGIDFVSECLVPGKLTDQKYYEFELRPQQEQMNSEIVARAEELRRTAHSDGIPVNNNAALFNTAQVAPLNNNTAGSIVQPAQ